MDSYPHITKPPESETDWFEALIGLARYLRTPDGCPWDREQSSADFVKYLQEEAEELREAVASGDDRHAEEEFGDTFFTLLAAIAAAEEKGRLTMKDVLQRIHDKMIRRHEHVFGEVKAETSEDAIKAWNRVKEQEKSDGVS